MEQVPSGNPCRETRESPGFSRGEEVKRIQFSPGSFRRKFTALDLDLLMAVIAVCLAPAVHPIAADIILTALAVWAMRNSR